MNSNPDVLVVGAGHNGLVAACYLARPGLTVQVIEAQDKIGGCTTSAAGGTPARRGTRWTRARTT